MKKSCIIAAAALLMLSACNTFQGMGKDIEATGEAISGTASETKEKMNDQ